MCLGWERVFSSGAEGGTRLGLFAGVCRCPRRASFLDSLSSEVCDCLLLFVGSAVSIAVRFAFSHQVRQVLLERDPQKTKNRMGSMTESFIHPLSQHNGFQ